MTTSTTSKATNGSSDDPVAAARNLAGEVADRAATVASRLPDAASATGAQIGRANEIIQSESDEVLAVGTSLSLGLAMGLLLGGASRILVLLALIPATAMGYTLFDRHGGSRPTRSVSSGR